ncbi:MAG: zinc ribbon domain-containing protein [Candidatus Thermoplasmatota archaeon]
MTFMRTRIFPALFALCIVSALALSANVSAEERAILAGDSYSIQVELEIFDISEYSWSSDVPLDFALIDPDGTEYISQTGAYSGTGWLPSYMSGTYTLTWENPGLTVAHLEFDVSGAFTEAEEAISFMTWALIIAAIVIVAVVVIVVVVVVMGGRKAPAPPAPGMQAPMAAQAMATGHCPVCGTMLDPNAAFCSRCGTRYK